MKNISFKHCAYLSVLLWGGIFLGGPNFPIVWKLVVSPRYVCPCDDVVNFEWDIDKIDKVRIEANTGEILTIAPKKGTYTTTKVAATWDFVYFRVRKGGKWYDPYFTVEVIQKPKWTKAYFVSKEEGLTKLAIGDIEIDPEPDPGLSQDKRGAYWVSQLIEGYSYRFPSDEFPRNARVITIKPDRLTTGYFLLRDVDPTGMFVEARGAENLPKTWVPKGQTLSISGNFHPSETTWFLYYEKPLKVPVAISHGRSLEEPDVSWWPSGDYPSMSFELTCSQLSSPLDDCKPSNGISVYDDVNYKGDASFMITDTNELGSRGLNDRVSSVRLIGSSKAILYEHNDFRGRALYIDGDMPDTHYLDFKDNISSIKVYDAPLRGITVYEHSQFHGKSTFLVESIANLKAIDLNDQISSIKLHGPVRAVVYEHANFQGKSREITLDTDSMGSIGMHDNTSSIEIFF